MGCRRRQHPGFGEPFGMVGRYQHSGSGSPFEENGWEEIREAALLGSGRPILLVPSTGIEEGSFETVVIAWKDSIEVALSHCSGRPFSDPCQEGLLGDSRGKC